ncbi:MAG: HlyD family efflux transporter periplasmic adaptor subunit, partial [Bacteroidales bacterium]|nr:HlyD family efflux transporter periplasmic adaptor subunit [Bacteroidales bacterium]
NAAAALSDMANKGARQEQIQGALEMWNKAKAGLDIAKKSYERINRLYEEGVMTAQKRDEVYANYQASLAQEKAAKSQYDMAVNGAREEERRAAAEKVNMAKGNVNLVKAYKKETIQIANIDGEVSEIYPKIGELVGTGSPIMTISITDDIWGSFNVREDQLKGMKMGDVITAYVPAIEKDIKLKVYFVKDQGSYAVWKATKASGQYDMKTFEVKARPTEKLEGIRPGMSLIMKQ